MCYDSNARPPEPPGTPTPATGEDIVLTSADGTRFAAYFAQPSRAARANLLIYPDVRGLHQFYRELPLRFAEQGINALAIDYFGRTAGLSPRDDSFDYMPHVEQVQFASFLSDVHAALSYLQDHSQTPDPKLITNPSPPTFLLGFCMGGSLALYSGAEDLPLAGIIAFYAGLSRTRAGRDDTPLEQAAHIHYPVLGLFGGADQGVPPEDVQQLDTNLDKAGVEHNIITYPGTPHSFFDRKYKEYAQECADAWNQVLNFISAHTSPTN